VLCVHAYVCLFIYTSSEHLIGFTADDENLLLRNQITYSEATEKLREACDDSARENGCGSV
jgi:hypothetical protein